MSTNNKIIVIVGPTASGKSDLAVRIALRLHSSRMQKKFGVSGAEVISADSRQVYRGMNLGSGKITEKEMAGVAHHLLDVASPRQRFSAARYKKLAQKAIKIIRQKNKLPIICGGSGFYVQAVTDNLEIPEVKPDWKFRAELGKKSTEDLFSMLAELDPVRAQNIDRHNRRRLIRAIEIVKKTGRPVPELSPPAPLFKREVGGLDVLFLGIKKSNEELQRNIAKRLKDRLKKGMIKEVANLRAQGISWKKLEEFGLEYSRIAQFLQGKLKRREMIARLQKDTEQFARRQMTWFKRDKRIRWIKNFKEAIKIISSELAE